ncbi:Glucosamine-6-phosphate deaminase [Carpediemonas membranifera]|uniref:N-acetylglucosaminylphosphatidylinositol deacetylase n=1 Tax=Carpediemonas membranifera TaxID=201153 RepID=A0A8J6E375_9EUKA|nr:Glucosamine-6-phosphate deaminase [Carpediemonas membranifera]|eukprot:KAG9395573.1 Glucosamine-6-phosphate deaminase [Carpediemonas membranifera]
MTTEQLQEVVKPSVFARTHSVVALDIANKVVERSKELGRPILDLDVSDFDIDFANAPSAIERTVMVDHFLKDTFMNLLERIIHNDCPVTRKQTVLFFSPHPDDDVISAGGMMGAMLDGGHDTHACYMTNGSVAVWNKTAHRHIDFLDRFVDAMSEADPSLASKLRSVEDATSFLKKSVEHCEEGKDLPIAQTLKRIIRESEAVSAVAELGMPSANAHFLDLPFYRTGGIKKKAPSDEDVELTYQLLCKVRPRHVFVAADLQDPHGTHRVCYDIIRAALARYSAGMPAPSAPAASCLEPNTVAPASEARPVVWLYRGAWAEWSVTEASAILPLSRHQLQRKVDAIYRHESQKDRAMFPGADPREFWQRAVDRNRATARELAQLGLPYFHACESYVIVWPEEMPLE